MMPSWRVGAYFVAGLSGLAITIAHPPLGWWWSSFLAPPMLVGALWLDAVRASGKSHAFRLGFVAGLVAFAPMIQWIIAPAGYVGWALLVAVQAGWWGVLAVLLARFRDHPLLPVIAAAVWTGIDAWRGVVPLSGFEWGALAYAHVDGSWLLPVARVLGARGITAFTVAIGVATLVLLRTGVRVVREDGLDGFARVLPRARVPTVLLVVSLAGSALVVADPPATDGSLRVLVVQGNDIRHWQQPVDDPVTRIATNLHADTLDALASGRDPDVVVWPESAIDRDPTRTTNAALAEIIADVAARPPELLAGTTLDGPDPAHTRYVAVSHYTDSGTAVDRYVKRRLVPFGEYVPARRLIGWFPPLAQVPRDALAGQGPQQFVVGDDVRIATVICFETLFGALVRDNVRGDGDYAHLVVATTNDASFRDSAEPAQHLAQSRMRAVETGRWVVHASLSGSSAFVDPNGVAHDTSPLFTRATIAREVPLATSATPFLVIGDLLGWITRAIVAVLLLAVLVGARRRASRRPSANR